MEIFNGVRQLDFLRSVYNTAYCHTTWCMVLFVDNKFWGCRYQGDFFVKLTSSDQYYSLNVQDQKVHEGTC